MLAFNCSLIFFRVSNVWFFKRTEFDRYAYFNAWSSTRETFDWDNMCEVKLPIPDIKIQETIVTIYHTLETQKKINEQLKAR
jgi:type I restriction enzyme S subunit